MAQDLATTNEVEMTNKVLTLTAAAGFAVSVASTGNVASATPFADYLAIKNATASRVDTVRWVRRRWVGQRFYYNCYLSGPYYPYGYACGPNYRYGW